jgi:hypothetical protein
MLSWEDRFNLEIYHAFEARENGNEGRARVCARRAAGVAAEEYLRFNGIECSSQNSIQNIRMLEDISGISQAIQAVISHFLVRVDSDYRLPLDCDLIQDAIWLRDNLINHR